MKSRQQGLATVEFAIVAAAFFTVLFGVIEVARALFVWNTVAEATRRGARVAAVCPLDHSAIREVAVFNEAGGGTQSPVLNGLTTDNVVVEYLDEDGNVTADFPNIRYVRVAISDYQHQMVIPFAPVTINVPPFATTVPVESLGYNPDTGDRECYGTST